MTDGRTDGQRDGQNYDSQDCAASRGKNERFKATFKGIYRQRANSMVTKAIDCLQLFACKGRLNRARSLTLQMHDAPKSRVFYFNKQRKYFLQSANKCQRMMLKNVQAMFGRERSCSTVQCSDTFSARMCPEHCCTTVSAEHRFLH